MPKAIPLYRNLFAKTKPRRRHGWDHGRRTTTSRGYGYQWQRLRKQILVRDSYLCQPCRRRGVLRQATEVDHIKPKAQGGQDNEENLQSICKACHQSKTGSEQRVESGTATAQ